MSLPPTASSAPDKSPSADQDEPWVAGLPAADQVAYRKAKLAWRQARAARDAAESAAQVGRDKPQSDFNEAMKKRTEAVTAKTGAVTEAGKKADALKAALETVEAAKPKDGDTAEKEKVAEAMKTLQTAMDECTAAVAAVVKKQDELSAAQATLVKVSDPKDPTKPDPTQVQLALAQYELDVANAEIASQAADETFREAKAVIKPPQSG